jgi:hypothetical protein
VEALAPAEGLAACSGMDCMKSFQACRFFDSYVQNELLKTPETIFEVLYLFVGHMKHFIILYSIKRTCLFFWYQQFW